MYKFLLALRAVGGRQKVRGWAVPLFYARSPCGCYTLGEGDALHDDAKFPGIPRTTTCQDRRTDRSTPRPSPRFHHVHYGPLWQAQLRCHQPKQAPHGPNLRLTYKVASKTVTESLPNPAAVAKAKREIAEFRRFEQLIREFVDVNIQICHSRPVEQTTESSQEKKRPKRSSRSSRGSSANS